MFGMRAWPTPFVRPMWPFLAGGLITAYGVAKLQSAMLAAMDEQAAISTVFGRNRRLRRPGHSLPWKRARLALGADPRHQAHVVELESSDIKNRRYGASRSGGLFADSFTDYLSSPFVYPFSPRYRSHSVLTLLFSHPPGLHCAASPLACSPRSPFLLFSRPFPALFLPLFLPLFLLRRPGRRPGNLPPHQSAPMVTTLPCRDPFSIQPSRCRAAPEYRDSPKNPHRGAAPAAH